ncbi:Nuclear fusion defective [Thalictrum thalictroides]|uniref:Nuclear fusion defective n=1 Tax=Thalictrum thalictroides TaxID=46969 RepID=A0A7J6VNR6_THATH|nr:Nuclear fusion defective [Thalictrum thalictroides]
MKTNMENPSGLRPPLIPWLSLVGIILLQSSSNTISNFPAYSAQLIQLLSISSLQLNSLIVASELGKLLDCFCIIALEHLPLWAMLAIGMVLGSMAYVVQFLFLLNKITYLSYGHLLLLHFLAGNSICWFNTVCSHAAESNFLIDHHQTVIALTSTYSGLSGKLYTLLVEAVHGPGARNASTYLILNCVIPIGVGLVFLLIVRVPPKNPIKSVENGSFSFIFMIAAVIGGYAVFDSVSSAAQQVSPRLRLAILVVLIILPIVMPIGKVLERFKLEKWHNKIICQTSSSDHHEADEQDIENMDEVTIIIDTGHENKNSDERDEKRDCVEKEEQNGKREEVQANDLGLKELLLNVGFWLYFLVNACGSTLIMAYFNNLGRISKSRAQADAPFLLAISSSFGFFGRLFTVIFDWFTRYIYKLQLIIYIYEHFINILKTG